MWNLKKNTTSEYHKKVTDSHKKISLLFSYGKPIVPTPFTPDSPCFPLGPPSPPASHRNIHFVQLITGLSVLPHSSIFLYPFTKNTVS